MTKASRIYGAVSEVYILETRVKFVIHEGEVLALFPDLPERDDCITSYARIGQHSPASKSLMRCKKAKPDQYFSLLKELRNIYESDTYEGIIILKVM